MAVKIKIKYPEDASEEDVSNLKKLEQFLKEKLVILTDSTHENYGWDLTKKGSNQNYYSLHQLRHSGNSPLFTIGIKKLATEPTEKLTAEIEFQLLKPNPEENPHI